MILKCPLTAKTTNLLNPFIFDAFNETICYRCINLLLCNKIFFLLLLFMCMSECHQSNQLN